MQPVMNVQSPHHLTTLLVVGASARAGATSVMRAGLRPLAADGFCDSDLSSLCDCERLAPYPTDAERVFANVMADAWMYVGGLENHPKLVERLAQRLPLLGNSSEVLRNVRDPRRVAAALRAQGLSAPMIMPPGHVPQTGSWISKPLRSCGGNGVVEWNARGTGSSVDTTSCHSEPPGRVFQQRINGLTLGAIFVADATHSQLLGVTEQLSGTDWLGAKDYMYSGSIGPIELVNSAQQQLRDIGEALTSAFRLRGIFGVDAIWDGADMWPIEVNPRYTASVEVLERSLGVSIVRAHVEACLNELQLVSLPTRPRLSGKAVVYAREAVVVSDELLDFIVATNSERELPSIADIPHGSEQIHQGRPVVSIFAAAPEVDQVVRRLKELARSIGGLLYGKDSPEMNA
jgi:predicted ATP-grasp superfamily ATP-dependent carboligase